MHNFLVVFISGLIAIFIILPLCLCFEMFKSMKSLSQIYKVLFYDENNEVLSEGKTKEYNH